MTRAPIVRVHGRSGAALAATVAALAVALLGAPRARAGPDDYRVDRVEWNGLSDLAALARSAGLIVEERTVIDWSEIGPTDTLFVLYPRAPLPPADVAAFLRRGGRLLLADDHGQATEALAKLGLLRRGGAGVAAARWHDDNPALPVATPRAPAHPLATGVTELVTNHPAVFRADQGPTVVFAFGPDEALVVAGGLGEGRFVALADPSVLINAMMAFDGNAVFATNLLAYLAPPVPPSDDEDPGPGDPFAPGGRVIVLARDFQLTGSPPGTLEGAAGGTVNEVLGDFGKFLDELNDYLASDRALQLLAIVAAAIVLLVGGAAAFRPTPAPDGAWTRVTAPELRDFERLVALYDDPRASGSFAYPAAVLRDLAEAALVRAVGQPEPLALGPVELARGAAGRAGPEGGRIARRLADRIRVLPTRVQAQAPWGARYVSRREFAETLGLLHQLEGLLETGRAERPAHPAPPPGDG